MGNDTKITLEIGDQIRQIRNGPWWQIDTIENSGSEGRYVVYSVVQPDAQVMPSHVSLPSCMTYESAMAYAVDFGWKPARARI